MPPRNYEDDDILGWLDQIRVEAADHPYGVKGVNCAIEYGEARWDFEHFKRLMSEGTPKTELDAMLSYCKDKVVP